MATTSRRDPLRNFRFRVEIDGIAAAGFSEVVVGAITTQAIDYREGTDPPHVRKLSGLTKYGNVILKRGISDSLDLYNWSKLVVEGELNDARRSVVIVVADESGAERARFVVREAWPVRYEAGALSATGNEVLIETVELANEGIDRT